MYRKVHPLEHSIVFSMRIKRNTGPQPLPFWHRFMPRFYSTSTSPRLGDSISYWQKRVLYVDRGVIVLNKPNGLICQKTQPGCNDEFASSVTFLRRPICISPKTFFGWLILQDGRQRHTSFNECLNSKYDASLSFSTVKLINASPGLRRSLSLNSYPYPVHRLDKVTISNT